MKLFVMASCAALTLTAAESVSAGEVVGRVTKVTFHLDNWNILNYNDQAMAHIYVEGLPAACGTAGNTRVVISNRNPLYNTVVGAALAAQARGAQIRAVYLDSCTVRAGSWDLLMLEVLEN